MCQPASPGSVVLGNRTGIVPPTPWRGIQRPGPRSSSYTLQSAADVPAAANEGPSGHAKRTTGFFHVTGSPGSTPRARSSSSINATHVRTMPGATAPRTAMNPSARKFSITLVMARHAPVDQILELIALVGFYHLVSFFANSLRLPLESYGAPLPP